MVMTSTPPPDPPPRNAVQRLADWLVDRSWPGIALVWLARRLATPWWAIGDAARVFWACRASLLAVIVGGGLIVFTDQARDIVISNVDPRRGWSEVVGMTAYAFLWAVVSWYWARVTLNYSFVLEPVAADEAQPPTFEEEWRDFWVDQVPRLIAFGAVVSFGWAFLNAAEVYQHAGDLDAARTFRRWFWMYLGGACVLYAVLWIRKPVLKGLIIGKPNRPPRVPPTSRARHLLAGRAHYDRLRDYLSNPLAASVLAISLIAPPCLAIAFALDPVGTSAIFGTAVNATLLGLAAMVPITSFLVLLSKRTRLPIFAGTIVWMVAATQWAGDNHDVRTLKDKPLALRPHVDAVFKAWWAANVDRQTGINVAVAPSVYTPPFIVVATAGGASRAGYWTTQVLGEIAEREAHFADRVFLISGVSGGSLGAVAFRSLVEAERRKPGGGAAKIPQASSMAAEFIKSDFLGPAMAAGLYVDLPLHAFPGLSPDDRAAALEKAWEAAWARTIKDKGRAPFAWDAGFVDTFAVPPAGADRDRVWPILALNGTSVEKGKRIVTSNVRFQTTPQGAREDLAGQVNRYDAFDILGRDIRISTAVTMSARFPVISPTGGMRDDKGVLWARITDGGLYENFGAVTADEVLRYVVERRADTQGVGGRPVQYPVWPMVILISSDPALDRLEPPGRQRVGAKPECAIVDAAQSEARRRARGLVPPPPPFKPDEPPLLAHPGNDWLECEKDASDAALVIVDPGLALYNGRVARGEAAATALYDRIIENKIIVRDRMEDAVRYAGGTIDEVKDRLGALGRRLRTDSEIDVFHFRQCKVAMRKGPTMSWHDSGDAWDVMNKMLGLDPGAGDPCGNRAEFVRLCVRLATVSGLEAQEAAAARCEKDWAPAAPPPAPLAGAPQ